MAPPADVVARLRAAGCVFAEDEARLLAAAALSPAELEQMVRRRVAGLPLEHVLGWAEFAGLRIGVAPGVFVPRPRSELLVAEAVALLRGLADPPVVVDLCCGCGALGLAVACAVPAIELHAADIDPGAVACARGNLAGLGDVYEGDLYDALPRCLRGRVDVLLANVPYVPTDAIPLLPAEAREHEPRTALDGGPDGLDVLRRVASAAPGWLAPGGHLLSETSERQASAALAVLEAAGLRPRVIRSEELDATAVAGRRAAAAHA